MLYGTSSKKVCVRNTGLFYGFNREYLRKYEEVSHSADQVRQGVCHCPERHGSPGTGY